MFLRWGIVIEAEPWVKNTLRNDIYLCKEDAEKEANALNIAISLTDEVPRFRIAPIAISILNET